MLSNRTVIVATIAASLSVGLVCWAEKPDTDAAPAAVRAAVKRALDGHKLNKFEKEDEDGKAVYEASFEAEGKDHTVTFSEAGEIVEEETEFAVADLPPAVSAEVLKAQPLARVSDAALVRRGGEQFYEVAAKVGKQKHELSISADGKLISDKIEKIEKSSEKSENKHDKED